MGKIKSKEIVADIRARVSDFELMSRYGLSLKQLEKVLVRTGGSRRDQRC